MYRIKIAIWKELLLLKRDIGGLLTIFLMPLVLVIVITLIQNGAMDQNSKKIPLLLVDNDKGLISENVVKALSQQSTFEVINQYNNAPLDETTVKKLVFDGTYQLAIVLPNDLSTTLDKKVKRNVSKIMSGAAMLGATTTNKDTIKSINIYFDPATQQAFKDNVKNAINTMVSEIETQTIYKTFEERLGISAAVMNDNQNMLAFNEIMPEKNGKTLTPSAVQHNVPAWLLFAIFFINMPIALSLVKEKNHGINVRLRASPAPYWMNLGGKIGTYLIIVLLQFFMMILVGRSLFPHIGLPVLETEGRMILLTIIAICAGLAAIGLGVLIGTITKTQEQASPFSSLIVVILAALGGIWVPIYLMPKVLQGIAVFSPLNWGLSAFYDVLLRNNGMTAILPELGMLLSFAIITIGFSIIYDKKKRAI